MNIKLKFFVLLLPFLSTNALWAQEKNKIHGQLFDNSKNVIPYAAIALYNNTDSSIVSGTATDDRGKFEFKVENNSYLIKISFLAFEDKWIGPLQMENKSINLGAIFLEPKSMDLEEFEVVSEKSQMTLNLDKRVFNVGQDLSNAGTNTLELLENVPSVSVDVEGNVGLRGSQNARILINGKPSGLLGISSADALRQLPSSMIESIEVITNPSARYEAEGEAGIINIILKKERKENLNGSFEVTAGTPDNYAASYNLNYRKGKVNLFSSYGISFRSIPGNGYSYQRFGPEANATYMERYRDHRRGGLSNNITVGADYSPNQYNTFTFSGLYRNGISRNPASIEYLDYDNNEILVESTLREELEIETKNTYEGSFSYLKTFEEKDRQLTIDFKFIESLDNESADITQSISNIPIDDLQRVNNDENERNLLFQADYVHPFGKKRKFETGFRSSFRTISNNFLVEQLDENEDWNVFQGFNNEFVYQENIHAAYAIYSAQNGALSYQFGLRSELSDIYTELKLTNERNPQNYLNFFPSIHFSYEVNEENTFQISYSRRLSRPRFRHLLPFWGFADNRNFMVGNPLLRPEFTDSYEIGYLRYFEKGSVLSSVYYRHRTGVIERIMVADSTGFTRRFPVNLATENAFGIEFSGNYKLAKDLNLNANFNFFRAITRGEYEGQLLERDTYTWTTRSTLRYRVLKKVNTQVAFNYSAPQQTPQGRMLALYSIDLGSSVDVLKGNGTLTFSVRDLLNSRVRRTIIDTPDFYSYDEFQWRARMFTLTFNYRLNQKNDRKSQRQQGGDFGGDFD